MGRFDGACLHLPTYPKHNAGKSSPFCEADETVEPLTLLVSGGVMVLVAGIAVSLQAMRACRIDPLVAMRQD